MSQVSGMHLQVCLVHYKTVDVAMVQKLRFAIEQALSAAELETAHDNATAKSLASQKQRWYVSKRANGD